MTHDEARFILQACRPDGSDASDATLGAALELARQDPALRAWYERQQAFDRAVAAKLQSVAPPAGLRTAILAGGKVSGGRTAWWRQPQWLALAASLVLLLAVGAALWPKPAVAGTSFMDFVLNDARHSETHGGAGSHTAELRTRLDDPATHLGDPLAIDFENLRITGCRRISFQGRDVLEVCFNRNGQWFHCYMVRKADFPSLIAQGRPVITGQGRLYVATWTEKSCVFMVVSKAGLEALEKLI